MPEHYLGYLANLEEGLETHDLGKIEKGLPLAYDLLVDAIIDRNREELVLLARDLNSVYLPHKNTTSGTFIFQQYLGQLRALINLSDYLSNLLVPIEALRIAREKKPKHILQILHKRGTSTLEDLRSQVTLTELVPVLHILGILMEANLVRCETFGADAWYSLTSTGRLVLEQERR